jgi:hypothetical protein
MRGDDLRIFLSLRALAVIAQIAAIAALMPFISEGPYFTRAIVFAALTVTAGVLNLCSRATNAHRRRTESLPEAAPHGYNFFGGLFGGAFGIAAFVYLVIVPTWPVLTAALFLGGCATYMLSN